MKYACLLRMTNELNENVENCMALSGLSKQRQLIKLIEWGMEEFARVEDLRQNGDANRKRRRPALK